MHVLSGNRGINKNKNSFHGHKYLGAYFFFTCNAKILVIKATFCKSYNLHKKIFISYIVKDNFGIQQHSQLIPLVDCTKQYFL